MTIDLLFVGIAVYGFYVGFSRGIIKTIISVVSIIVGIIAALRFAPKTTDLLKECIEYCPSSSKEVDTVDGDEYGCEFMYT